MKIKSVVQLILAATLVLCTSLILISVWVDNRLSATVQSEKSFNELVTFSGYTIKATISKYVTTGDATLLTQAGEQFEQLQTRVGILPEALQENLAPQIESMIGDLNGKFRASGKLSGDPYALLVNAEREMVGYVESLTQYTEAGLKKGNGDAVGYLPVAGRLNFLIGQLIHQRQKYFDIKQALPIENLQQTADEIIEQAGQLHSLPLLGVFAEVDEDDFDFDEEKVDLGEEPISELNSLGRRYMRELTSTDRLIKAQRESIAEVGARFEQINELIRSGEQNLSVQREFSEGQILVSLYVLSAVIGVFMIWLVYVQQRVVLRPVEELRQGLLGLISEGAHKSIPVRKAKTEFGALTTLFNELIGNLKAQQQEREQQLETVAVLLSEFQQQIQLVSAANEQAYGAIQNAQYLTDTLDSMSGLIAVNSERACADARKITEEMNHWRGSLDNIQSVSDTSNRCVQDNQLAVNVLLESIKGITGTVDDITTIAEQTNLLALNAAIEAARAGQHGRGFSVVADEVRTLSNNTQKSLSKITELLAELSNSSMNIQGSGKAITGALAQQEKSVEQLREMAGEVHEDASKSNQSAQQNVEHVETCVVEIGNLRQAMLQVQQRSKETQSICADMGENISAQIEAICQSLGIELDAR